ncbi:MAG: hypothetical protein AAFP26_13560, partial [Planctomycetota bacterium]
PNHLHNNAATTTFNTLDSSSSCHVTTSDGGGGAAGEIGDLFTEEEATEVVESVRAEVRASGLRDTRDQCWRFFLERVRARLRLVLCFSPVGAALRVRARRFPALVGCAAVDVFRAWPHEALVSVSARFVAQIGELRADGDDDAVRPKVVANVAAFMAHAHETVGEAGVGYRRNERRQNYTTPKSFLEQIDLYRHLIGRTSRELRAKMERLENGLAKLHSTSEQASPPHRDGAGAFYSIT